MPDVIFPGPEGRIEGRFSPPPRPRAPVALILHPHPQGGGTMNHKVVFTQFHVQELRRARLLRSSASTRAASAAARARFDNGIGELSDAAAALDWLQSYPSPTRKTTLGRRLLSFGAWIGMQLLMRRPEIRRLPVGRAARQHPTTSAFLAPCPSSGLIVAGGEGRGRAPGRRSRSWSTSCAPKRALRSITTKSRAPITSSSMSSIS
jgi:alpha/beta superfamily hydrolase